ncbi:MAG: MFS transporter, partial [Spirochaetaceae bacterium]
GAGMAALSAAGVGLILGRVSFPHSFAILFALSFLAAAISWVGLALNREPDSPSIKPRITHREYFRRLPSLLRSEKNYRRFLLFESLIHIGAMANGFFMVGAVRRFGVDATWVGVYTGSLAATQALMYLVWGVIADRHGHKTVLVCGAIALVVGNVVGFLARSPLVYTVSFVGMGLFLAAEMVSRMNITLEFCEPEDRPTFIGITNTVVAPSVAIAPIIGGVFAGLFGYRGLTVLGAGVLLFAVAGMMYAVTDPRALVGRRGTSKQDVTRGVHEN